MKVLIRLFRRSPLRSIGTAVVSLVGGLAISGALFLLGSPTPHSVGTVVAFAILSIVAVGARSVALLTMRRLGVAYNYELRTKLCEQISRLSLRELELLGASRLHATLTEDVAAVSTAGGGVGLVLADAAIVVATLGYLAVLSPIACGLALVAVGISVAVIAFLGRSLAVTRERFSRRIDDLYGYFGALTQGAKELRLSTTRREAFLERGVRSTATELAGYAEREGAISVVALAVANFTLVGTMGLVVFASSRFATESVAARFVVALLYVIGPLQNVVSLLSITQQAGVALGRIDEVARSVGARAEPEPSPESPSSSVVLTLKDVCYSYDGANAFSIGPVDLMLRSGELLFIVGGNGSGKSTLLNVLLGLYSPTSGEIVLNGTTIRDDNRTWLTAHFAAIFADFYLFERIWDEEVALRADIANRYIREMGLEGKVRFEEGRFSTTALSSGQRKRLALVAALMEDRPIYVFDEWAADQDPFFKRTFYDRILPALAAAGKAVVAVTHDDRYFHVATSVIKLEDGRRVADIRVPEAPAAGI